LALLLFVCGEAVHHGEEQAATNLIDWNWKREETLVSHVIFEDMTPVT
jgi:hypothetical protein